MELRHLRYFVAVAEDLNFSRAARRLHVSQPPLTQAIKRLEDELRVQLFDRTTRSVRLTEKGSLFSQRARDILSQVERAMSDMHLPITGAKEVLRVGLSGTGGPALPVAVRNFRRRFPQVHLELLSSAGRSHPDFLMDGGADLNIGEYFPANPQLDSRWWIKIDLVAVLPASHPLAKRSQISIRELHKDTLFLPELGNAFNLGRLNLGREALRFCREVGRFEPRSFQHCDDIRIMMTLVGSEAGVGISIAPPGLPSLPNLVFVPFREKAPSFTGGVVWRRDRETPALRGLVEEVESSLRPLARLAHVSSHFRPGLFSSRSRTKRRST